MSEIVFPRTAIGTMSCSRMIIGTNNIVGGSHRTKARDEHIMSFNNDPEAVAEIVETYLEYGVDTIIGFIADRDYMINGVRLAEQRTGKKVNTIQLSIFDCANTKEAYEETGKIFDFYKASGIDAVFPLHFVVEKLVNKGEEKIERIEDYLYMIREREMIPGLSAHMPEIVTYTDKNGYDVESYIQIYNSAGFMMQVEVETVNNLIWKAKKPVLTIKPMAAGHLNPFVGLTFVWNTIRPQDMVAVGCMTPGEVRETIEYSLASIEHRHADVQGRLYQYKRDDDLYELAKKGINK